MGKYSTSVTKLNLALFLDEISILMNIRDSKQLWHNMVPEVSRSNFHGLTSFTELLDALQKEESTQLASLHQWHQEKIVHIAIEPTIP